MNSACIERGLLVLVALLATTPATAVAQRTSAQKVGDARRVLEAFTTDETNGIPADLIARARGMAILPDVFRGGFFVGGRRGRGVMTVRGEDGQWSIPAFVNLTGGSIGWQFGGETMDVVLVFANDNAIKNIASGKFTLGGDAAAVAGPADRRATMAVTFKAEVYSYVRSRGLFAGAAFEGARLAIDAEAAIEFYGDGAAALGPVTSSTPPSVIGLIDALGRGAEVSPSAAPSVPEPQDEAKTFPLGN
jgi:lipid-binding SYLF domain-containing protein